MNVARYQTLFTGIGHNDVHRLVSALEPYPVDFHRVPWHERATAALTSREFHLVFVGYPAIGMSLQSLVTPLRQPSSASRAAGLVVLAEPRSVTSARRLLGHGVNRVLSSIEDTEVLLDASLPLLNVARRIRLRAPVEMILPEAGSWTPASCQTEDVSSTGMLVSCTEPAPAGATVDFALAIPGEPAPIRGRARVARHTDPSREQVLGVGASFLSFTGNDQQRLNAALWGHRGTLLDDPVQET
jgi:hypothetical protein